MDALENNTTETNLSPLGSYDELAPPDLLSCCKNTIEMHAAYNSMMVCSDCKQIIKCFNDEKAFINYQRFCASRHRKILATEYSGRYIVVFNSYDTYST